MKKPSSLLLLVTLMMVNIGVFACKGTDVLYQDSFIKLDPSWGVTDAHQSVNNNMFVIKPDVNMTHYTLNQSGLFQDMDYCVDVQLLNGDDSTVGAGPIFWGKDMNDYYFLYVVGDGSYYVGRYDNGRYLVPVASQTDPIINKGNAVNHLRVVTKGNQATIYINDKQMTSFTGQVPDGGGIIGVQADSPQNIVDTWGFSNIKITKPQ